MEQCRPSRASQELRVAYDLIFERGGVGGLGGGDSGAAAFASGDSVEGAHRRPRDLARAAQAKVAGDRDEDG